MRVLQVVTDTDRRGAQVFAVDLHRALVARNNGVEVTTVALAPGAVGGLPLPVLGRRRRGPVALARLRRRTAGADVVVAHGSATFAACWAALAGTGVPFVSRQVSDPVFWTGRWTRRVRVRLYYRAAARVVALSAGAGRLAVEHFGVEPGTVDVIPNAVDPAAFAPPSPSERAAARERLGIEGSVVAYVGALAAEKGVDDLLRAAGRLPGVTVVVVGDGPERPALVRLAAQLASDVRFTGRVDDVRSVLCAADAVVLPSRSDMMPAVLIEAACMGLPVVATRVGSVPEVVEDGVTGLLVDPSHPAALETAIRRLVSGDAGLQLGRAARERALDRFDIAAVAAAWEVTLHAAVDACAGR